MERHEKSKSCKDIQERKNFHPETPSPCVDPHIKWAPQHGEKSIPSTTKGAVQQRIVPLPIPVASPPVQNDTAQVMSLKRQVEELLQENKRLKQSHQHTISFTHTDGDLCIGDNIFFGMDDITDLIEGHDLSASIINFYSHVLMDHFQFLNMKKNNIFKLMSTDEGRELIEHDQPLFFDGADFILCPFPSVTENGFPHWNLLIGGIKEYDGSLDIDLLILNSYGKTVKRQLQTVLPLIQGNDQLSIKKKLVQAVNRGYPDQEHKVHVSLAKATMTLMQAMDSNDCALHVLAHMEAFLFCPNSDYYMDQLMSRDKDAPNWLDSITVKPCSTWRAIYIQWIEDLKADGLQNEEDGYQ
ncbi:Peptidase C48, SUMO/Sentrin/Ubl1 [Ascosphaera apis ARSEF 7405]|uniref:Peptidase C48, SUMO/Sentrin/Ubl1 n=1 Tax=Ascosphaera apis ARSEF 7405 TaxID=392613 RepID=A0A168BQ83_9EURO|nr:Peptidase C48, SUMO/Sentrin/Ubl1 [Ascosphaera apis ARSEF 7405]